VVLVVVGLVANIPVVELHQRHPDWSEATFKGIKEGRFTEKEVETLRSWPWEAIVRQKIALGMTCGMVRASWGSPSHVNRSVYLWGTREQWVYRPKETYLAPIHGTWYLYFDDGVLVSWQETVMLEGSPLRA
jgi:hypothetical protein